MNINEQDNAGALHMRQYGKSDKLNAPENQNADFQEGFRRGMTTFGRDEMTSGQLIVEEMLLRRTANDCCCGGFNEWKRGFWAARNQMIAACMRRLPTVKGLNP